MVAIASSKWFPVDTETKRIKKITPEISDPYGETVTKSVFEEPFKEKLTVPENLNFNFSYTTQRRDIDTNHHVNNLNYLDYAYQALPEDIYFNINFSNVEIMYKHEAKLGDTISLFYSSTERNEHIITIKDKKGEKLHAIVKLY